MAKQSLQDLHFRERALEIADNLIFSLGSWEKEIWLYNQDSESQVQ